jgi:hypothetical protein
VSDVKSLCDETTGLSVSDHKMKYLYRREMVIRDTSSIVRVFPKTPFILLKRQRKRDGFCKSQKVLSPIPTGMDILPPPL